MNTKAVLKRVAWWRDRFVAPSRPHDHATKRRSDYIALLLVVVSLWFGGQRVYAAPAGQATDTDVSAEIAALTAADPTFVDDFNTWDEQWTLGSDGGATNHDGDAAAVTVQGLGNKAGWITHATLASLELADYYAETTILLADAPTEAMVGLFFRYTDADNFYGFAIQQEADAFTVALFSLEAGNERSLIEPQPLELSPADGERTPVKVGVLVKGEALTLLIDDAVVATVTDGAHPTGTIALGGGLNSAASGGFQFDRVALWGMAATPVLASEVAAEVTAADLPAQLDAVRATDPADLDEFRRTSEGWSGATTDLVTLTVADGVRRVTVAPEGFLYDLRTALVDSAPTDYLVEVDTSFAAGHADNQYGLVFRYLDDQTFYLFALDSDTYTLWRNLAGEWTALVEAQSAEVMAPRGENRLGVVVQGDMIVLLINGTVVAQAQDETIPAGGVGLYAEAIATSAEDAIIDFDNFEFWLLQEPLTLTNAGDDESTTPVVTAFDEAAIAETLAAITEGEADVYDEFRREDGAWLGDARDAVTIAYVDRQRQIAAGPNLVVVDLHAALLDLAPADYLAAIDTSFQGGDVQSQYGLVFRYQDGQNFYYYGLWRNTYSLWVQAEGTWTKLIDWTEADALAEGGENRLGVLAQGETITLLLNDTPLTQVIDTHFASGGVGLYVETEAEGEATVAFDNFDLWLLAAADEETTVTPTDDAARAALATTITALRETEATYYDGFRQEDGAWPTRAESDRTVTYENRTLVFAMQASNSLSFSAYTPEEALTTSDYYVEVASSYLEGEQDGNYGLLFRYVDNENFYFFEVNQGGYRLQKFEAGAWTPLLDWVTDERLTTAAGAVHLLGVWAAGADFALLLDGEIVATITDSTFPTGGVGLGAGTYTAENFVASFDDFQLWTLPATLASAVTPTPAATPALTATATPEAEPAATVTPDATAATALYEDETFRLPHPAGWTVAVEAGVVTAISTALDASLVIVPLYAPQPFTGAIADDLHAQWIELMEIEGVTWSTPVDWGAAGRRLTGTSADRVFTVAGTWVNTPAGSAYYLYTTGAAKATASTAAPLLAQMMADFTLKGTLPPVAPAGPTLTFTPWQEPVDGAFTLEVPTDWEIDGGVLRLSDIDQRQWVLANDPAESTFISAGDSRVSAFIVPNAALTAQGYAEGDSIFLEDTEFTVWPYRPGEEFLVDYAEQILDLTGCDLDPQPLPALTTAIRDYIAQNDLAVEMGHEQAAGLLTYACGTGDEAYVGLLVAVTSLYEAQGTELWQVTALYGYAALPADTAMAAAALQQLILTYATDAAWLQDALGYSARDAARLTTHAAALAQLLVDELALSVAESPIDTAAMDEFVTVDDPATGEAVVVFLDSTLGWLDSEENLLGTTISALLDGVDFAEVTQVDEE